MILDKTEDTFIVIACPFRAESYDDPLWGMWLNNTLAQWKWEHIAFVTDELEACWKITVVDHIQKTVRSLLHLNFTKLYRFWWEFNAEAIGHTLAAELKFIATEGRYFE